MCTHKGASDCEYLLHNHSCQMFQYSINIGVIMTSQFSYNSCFLNDVDDGKEREKWKIILDSTSHFVCGFFYMHGIKPGSLKYLFITPKRI